MFIRILLFILFSLISISSYARSSDVITYYYASIKSKSDVANVRTGPSIRYPIKWVYQYPNWPVKVVATFENWRKIKDIYGEVGWIHETSLTKKRYIVVKSKGVQELRRLPLETASALLLMEDGVVARLLECKKHWCNIRVENVKGWIQKKHVWGVDKKEIL